MLKNQTNVNEMFSNYLMYHYLIQLLNLLLILNHDKLNFHQINIRKNNSMYKHFLLLINVHVDDVHVYEMKFH